MYEMLPHTDLTVRPTQNVVRAPNKKGKALRFVLVLSLLAAATATGLLFRFAEVRTSVADTTLTVWRSLVSAWHWVEGLFS